MLNVVNVDETLRWQIPRFAEVLEVPMEVDVWRGLIERHPIAAHEAVTALAFALASSHLNLHGRTGDGMCEEFRCRKEFAALALFEGA